MQPTSPQQIFRRAVRSAFAVAVTVAYVFIKVINESEVSAVILMIVFVVADGLIGVIDEAFFVKPPKVTDLSQIQIKSRQRILALLGTMGIPYEVLTVEGRFEPYVKIEALDLKIYLYLDGEAGIQNQEDATRVVDVRLELPDFDDDPGKISERLIVELKALVKTEVHGRI